MKAWVLLGLSLSFLLPWGSFAQTYTLHNLGVLQACGSDAVSINASGQVAGNAAIFLHDQILDGFYPAAYRTQPGQAIHLGDYLGWDINSDYFYSFFATGMNASGQVVGWMGRGDIEEAYAYRTAPNQYINPWFDNLGYLGAGPPTVATGINDAGQVVGWSVGADNKFHIFRTAPNQYINPLTDDLGVGYAYAINAKGQVVGDIDWGAFRTAPNQPINPATDNLGSLGGGGTSPRAINASGQVVGYSGTSSGQTHAFRTGPNQPINPATDDLGSLGGSTSAAGINSQGQVVGRDSVAGAFVYRNGVLYNLNTLIPARSGWHLDYATSINDKGEIVGVGTSSTDRCATGWKATPNLAPTKTKLTTTLTPATYGQTLTYSATVANSFGSVPTGRVDFIWAGHATIGRATVNAQGVATLRRSNLNAGFYLLDARYSGDTNNRTSLSPALRQLIEPTPTSTSLVSSANPSRAGQAVTFTAQVTSPTVLPTGPVTFTAGSKVLGSVPLSAGVAQITAIPPHGMTQITATYFGDSNITESSASLTQEVEP